MQSTGCLPPDPAVQATPLLMMLRDMLARRKADPKAAVSESTAQKSWLLLLHFSVAGLVCKPAEHSAGTLPAAVLPGTAICLPALISAHACSPAALAKAWHCRRMALPPLTADACPSLVLLLLLLQAGMPGRVHFLWVARHPKEFCIMDADIVAAAT